MNDGWFNLILFLVLAGVIILCSFNIATYSDIQNGNTNAPDITDGECTVMIVINSLLLVAGGLTLIYYIYKVYDNATDLYQKGYDVDGTTIKVVLSTGKYTPNSVPVQIFLWIFSTFVFIVSIFNVVNATKLDSDNTNNAVVTPGAFLAFSWVLLVIALGYFLYTTFRTFIPKALKELKFLDAATLVAKGLSQKATIPSIIPCDCSKKVDISIDKFNQFLGGDIKLNNITDKISKYHLKG
jgi:hypothetical protein